MATQQQPYDPAQIRASQTPAYSNYATNAGTGGNWASDVGNFMTSPTGQLVTAAGVGGLGTYQASQAKSDASKLAGQITSISTPYAQAGAGMQTQLAGGKPMAGPLGTEISGTTAAATELTGVAQQYGTGALTPAQQTQVNSYRSSQRGMVDSQLAAAGNIDSSARAAAYANIDNNAAQLTQQLIQGNVSMAQGALSSVTNTYNQLLQQALASGSLGLQGATNAVQLQIQQDTQIAGILAQLYGNLAKGLTAGSGGGGGGGGGGGASGGPSAISQLIAKITGGGGGGVANPGQPQAQTAAQLPAGTTADITNMPEPNYNFDTGTGAQSYAYDPTGSLTATPGGDAGSFSAAIPTYSSYFAG